MTNLFYYWNVIGHTKALAALEGDIHAGAVHHAYLFVGPEKVGKFRVAKTFASILQCPQNFCRSCSSCIQIEKKCHPDVAELSDDGETIKISAVRELLARLALTGQSPYKIVLIENIGRLTAEAANSLLKTLEEPTEHTVFVFTANQLRDILPTVASRMRIIHFKKLRDEVLREALKKRAPEAGEDLLDQAILLSLGRSGKAIQLLEDPEALRELKEIFDHIQFLDEKGSLAPRFLAAAEQAADPQKMKTFLALLAHFFRRKMLAAEVSAERLRALRVIEALHRALDLMERNVNSRLLMEYVMMTS